MPSQLNIPEFEVVSFFIIRSTFGFVVVIGFVIVKVVVIDFVDVAINVVVFTVIVDVVVVRTVVAYIRKQKLQINKKLLTQYFFKSYTFSLQISNLPDGLITVDRTSEGRSASLVFNAMLPLLTFTMSTILTLSVFNTGSLAMAEFFSE